MCTVLPVRGYGAGENLCHLYWHNFCVSAVSLRLFTDYGARQGPTWRFGTSSSRRFSARGFACSATGRGRMRHVGLDRGPPSAC